MKRIYTQSEPTALSTGIAINFSFKDSKSLVQVTSSKMRENPDFDKPIKYQYGNKAFKNYNDQTFHSI